MTQTWVTQLIWVIYMWGFKTESPLCSFCNLEDETQDLKQQKKQSKLENFVVFAIQNSIFAIRFLLHKKCAT